MSLQSIGHIPDGETYLLAEADLPDDEPPPIDTMARILDRRSGVLYEPRRFHSITAHAPYFEAYDGEQTVDALLEGIDVRGPPADTVQPSE